MTVEAISMTFGLAFLLVCCLSAQIMIRDNQRPQPSPNRPRNQGTGAGATPQPPASPIGLRRAG